MHRGGAQTQGAGPCWRRPSRLAPAPAETSPTELEAGKRRTHSEPRGGSTTVINAAPSHQRLPPSATLTAPYLDRGTGLSSPAHCLDPGPIRAPRRADMQSRLHQAADFTLHYNAPLSFLKPRRRKTDLTKRGKVGSIESQSLAGAPSSMPAGLQRKPYSCGENCIHTKR